MNYGIALGLEILAGFILIGLAATMAIAVVLSWWSTHAAEIMERIREDRHISTAIVTAMLACSVILYGIAELLKGEREEGYLRLAIGGALSMICVVLFTTSNITDWWERRREHRVMVQHQKEQARYQRQTFVPPDDNDDFLQSIPGKKPRR
ncbi:TPA: hypothetical protein DD425_02880 [Candidatus Saccharibacteria bacterium]|nr:hypothetical protein [Candidatus Saccharibacteria bacterium]|tara:strand:+ start:2137 stop:2589 length:453 start_codon:yes stop_codon:yes gene_type:complete